MASTGSRKDSKMNFPLLALQGITKSFPGILANDHVDLQIYGGEVHALLGENGAGKSTLMKILYGFYRADAGEILLQGRPLQIRSPHDARQFRIGMVFQDFVQILAMTVEENIALFLPRLSPILDKKGLIREIDEISQRYGLQIDPSAYVRQLSVGERQKVEVLKLLLANAQVLILDEPTRSLAPHEIEGLFRVFANLRADGYAIVFITHKLKEVLSCADRITVMRRGRVAGTLTGSEAAESKLVSLMFGAAVSEVVPREPKTPSEGQQSLLELREISTRNEGEATALQDINLSIRPGEIVGVAGVSGNGQRELGDVVLGLERISRGSKYLWGQNATRWSVARVRKSGVAFIPEDPLAMGAFAGLTVLQNMALGNPRRYARHGGLSMDWDAVLTDFQRSMKRLGFAVPSMHMPLGTFSGGNIQRLILAKEMASDPKLIIAFYPTRGLDLRSATAVRELLLASRDLGAGVLLISEDLGELFSLADRLVVLFRGRIVGTGTPGEITINEVGYLMTGSRGEGGQRR